MIPLRDRLYTSEQPHCGDIILSYENTFFSKVVRWLTDSKWSHVSIYAGTLLQINDKIYPCRMLDNTEVQQSVEDDSEIKILKDCVISAVPRKGVSITKFYEIENKAVYRIDQIDYTEAERVIEFALNKLNQPYDYYQCVLLLYRIFSDTLLINKGDPNPDKFICSELVAKAFSQIGIEFGNIIDNILPETIAASTLTTRIK